MTTPPPQVSVVIATLNRPAMLLRCIDGLLAGSCQRFEVLVVDQSEDGSTRLALDARFGSDARVLYLHSEVSGSSHARNLGVASSRGELIAFIDDDAVPAPGWLSAYLESFRDILPTPGLVGGKITLAWDGTCPGWYPEACKFILGTYDAGDQVREYPPGDLPISANFALRRAALPAGPTFDTALGFGPRGQGLLAAEDSHLALRVLAAGGRLIYQPRAHVVHHVTAHKLSRRYFLRRFYWHGRALMKLRARPDGERRRWVQVWADRRRKRRAQGATRPSEPSPAEARLMLLAAYAAMAAGATVELLARLGARRGPPGRGDPGGAG